MGDYSIWVGIDDSADQLDVTVLYGNEELPRHEFHVVNDASGLGRVLVESTWH